MASTIWVFSKDFNLSFSNRSFLISISCFVVIDSSFLIYESRLFCSSDIDDDSSFCSDCCSSSAYTSSKFSVFSNREDAQEVAAYASRRERLIMEAERKVMDAYKAVYMQAYIGHKFEGIICQSSPKGLTVELKDHPIWCWCGMEQLPRGLEYDEHRFAWVHTQHTLSLNLGQSVWVQIDSVSIIEGKIEITLIDQPQKEPKNLLV